ncbi:hypothetical protein BDD12DRAFT_839289 [Trichophaea hybrida]|nr:hypothetical protein BDD12DRAFT_839289 [Trichophaea hybrida]
MGEGVKMAKDEVAFYYYNGLPLQDEGWEHFRVMIVMEKEYRQDPEKLQQAVRDREDLFWNKGEWGRARRRRKVTCYRCKKTGHYKNECPG